MPTGYAGEGKTFNKKRGRWEKTQREKTYDYGTIDPKVAGLIISFFRWYPDMFLDVVRASDARYKLEFPQRLMLRAFARYRNVMITGARGLTKTFIVESSKMHEGVFFPGEIIRYCAPAQKQAATLASQTFQSIENEYPTLASWWSKNNDRQDMFRITTPYGSEFTMYAPRGVNSSSLVGEEIGQEGENGFDFAKFENEISPTNRSARLILGEKDPVHINYKESYIGNASSQQNPAFTKYRASALQAMLSDNPYAGFCADISWITALFANIRDVDYFKKEKSKLTMQDWLREMCARYTGTGDNPVLDDETLAASRKTQIAELRHCGDDEPIYIVAHDVSYESGQNNAKCADVVLKCTPFELATKRDKFNKQAVYVDNFAPPATEALQAAKLKELWWRFCKEGGKPTYLVVDARAVGKTVVQELMKPSTDGTPCLCCINHEYAEIEQPGALPVIYPLKASISGVDSDYEMIKYAQREFEQGNIELLTSGVADGVEAYKRLHGIKNDVGDAKIVRPYRQTDVLCAEIANLQLKPGGAGFKEVRKSQAIQRDVWSALKYGLHFASKLEDELVKAAYRPKSSYAAVLMNGEKMSVGNNRNSGARPIGGANRVNLLAKRGR